MTKHTFARYAPRETWAKKQFCYSSRVCTVIFKSSRNLLMHFLHRTTLLQRTAKLPKATETHFSTQTAVLLSFFFSCLCVNAKTYNTSEYCVTNTRVIFITFLTRGWGLHFSTVLTLNIIIERTVSVAVFVEETKCVSIGKVFKLDQAIHTVPAR